jgi:hypothetical protein
MGENTSASVHKLENVGRVREEVINSLGHSATHQSAALSLFRQKFSPLDSDLICKRCRLCNNCKTLSGFLHTLHQHPEYRSRYSSQTVYVWQGTFSSFWLRKQTEYLILEQWMTQTMWMSQFHVAYLPLELSAYTSLNNVTMQWL